MEINPSANYSISRNGQEFGPYPGGELFQMAKNRQITSTDYLWTDGMPQWVQADTFPQFQAAFTPSSQASQTPQPIVPTVGQQQPQPQIQPAVQQPNPTSGQSALANVPVPRRNRMQQVGPIRTKGPVNRGKGASFGLWLFSLLWFASVFVVPFILMLVAQPVGEEATTSLFEQFLNSDLAQNGVFMSVIVGIMFAGLFFFPILDLIYLYRGWKYIQDCPTVTLSPGAAVGFMLIPIFNIIWMFIAYIGWAKHYNIRNNLSYSKSAPKVSEGLFITHHILLVVFGFWPLIFFMMYQMCRGINYLAATPELDKRQASPYPLAR